MDQIAMKASEYGLLGVVLAYLMFMHYRLEARVAERDSAHFEQRSKMIEAIVMLREAVNSLKETVLNDRH